MSSVVASGFSLSLKRMQGRSLSSERACGRYHLSKYARKYRSHKWRVARQRQLRVRARVMSAALPRVKCGEVQGFAGMAWRGGGR